MSKYPTQKGEKRKIAWVTPDYFVDCDFNPDVLKCILEHYIINWIILLPFQNARFAEKDFDQLKRLNGLTIEFVYSSCRQRSPKRLLYYYKLYKKIKKSKADIAYLNCVPDPYFVPILWLFDKKKTIFCAHDGAVHAGFDFTFLTKMAFKFSYTFAKYVCMFSKSQAKVFQQKFPKAKLYVINLALKGFGNAGFVKPDIITFLSFGVINYSKNIDLLIQAACNIYDRGYRNFQVLINGKCDNWEFYQTFIRYPDLFKCEIRIIGNSEISPLFSTAHYFVQPYRHVSQSGAMKVAFYYNLPVIASNYPGFSDEIVEGVNGYLFNPDKVENLENILIKLIGNHKTEYFQLVNRMIRHTKENYSSAVIADKYLKMFDNIINLVDA